MKTKIRKPASLTTPTHKSIARPKKKQPFSEPSMIQMTAEKQYLAREKEKQKTFIAELSELQKIFDNYLKNPPLNSFVPLLPAIFSLRDKPFTLEDNSPFEPFFRMRMPMEITALAARQVGKSTVQATSNILMSAVVPNLSTLCLTPLYEMIRRFSTLYVQPFIDTSPIKGLLVDPRTERSVLQRTFINRSVITFSFAWLDVTRTRGVPVDRLGVDEMQDLNPDFVPILLETMSASKWANAFFSGTPKSAENLSELRFQASSQGEWITPCFACNYGNVAALEYDLEKMIGPWRPDISRERPGTICAKCGNPISPRHGWWEHKAPELRWTHAGYHMPQIIFPMHFESADKWGKLIVKQNTLATATFMNEVCGESYDLGSRLVTLTELQEAAVLNENIVEQAIKHRESYIDLVLSVDWGGGGEDQTSWTTMAVLGMLPNGNIDCIFGYKSLTPHAHDLEAKLILQLIQKFGAKHLVHDFNGSGAPRETIIVQSGFPLNRVIPIAYVRSGTQNMMNFHKPSGHQPRAYYTLDKARSLAFTCMQIRRKKIRFFKDDYKSQEQPGLLRQFLALIEERMTSRFGSDAYGISRNPRLSDDFAQAVNMGCSALWYSHKNWPEMGDLGRYKLSQADVEYFFGRNATDPASPLKGLFI